jgi:hypothetical protein
MFSEPPQIYARLVGAAAILSVLVAPTRGGTTAFFMPPEFDTAVGAPKSNVLVAVSGYYHLGVTA